MAIVAFAKRRAQFKELLSCSNNLNSSRYFRLMALCGIDVLFTVPLSTFFMINNLDIAPLDPYISWANTHSYFGHIGSYPFIIWSQDRKRSVGVEVTKWSPVLCAFIFFGFFGFADEARKNYWHAYQSFAKRLGYTISSTSSNGATSSGGVKRSGLGTWGNGLPSFVRPQPKSAKSAKSEEKTISKKESLDSLQISVRHSIGSVFNELKEKDEEDIAPDSSSTTSSRSSRSSTASSILQFSDEGHLPSRPPSHYETTIIIPEPALDRLSPPRHQPDAPTPVEHARSDDIV
jgi:pheromone a factor receptor